ncbi:hypothetical protein H9624_03195 [Actinomycetaceae bacterium Sa1BUA1]|uniref:Uncharacterized protein n=1 Tax=Oceanitalea stevensii TaxID=2763072 RepID=A0ABR8YZ25_9MICO|nr:hypothetical protein [Oceanitalea stevensii]
MKTTTVRTQGSWKVYLSSTGKQRRTYKPDESDDFFVIDGGVSIYLIPYAAVGGLQAIHLKAYEEYRLPPFVGPNLGATSRSAAGRKEPRKDSARGRGGA